MQTISQRFVTFAESVLISVKSGKTEQHPASWWNNAKNLQHGIEILLKRKWAYGHKYNGYPKVTWHLLKAFFSCYSVKTNNIKKHTFFQNLMRKVLLLTDFMFKINVKLYGTLFHLYEQLTKILFKWLNAFLSYITKCWRRFTVGQRYTFRRPVKIDGRIKSWFFWGGRGGSLTPCTSKSV